MKHKTSRDVARPQHPELYMGPSYIKNYDSLRVIALFGVSLYHLLPLRVPGGFLAVVLFFVFAGFLTARSMMRRWTDGQTFNLKRYYIRRFLRLYPPLLLLVALSLLYTYFFMPGRFVIHRDAVPSILFGYNNYHQIGQDLSYFDQHGRFDAFVHLWAMGIEWQFYLLFPLICVILKEKLKLTFENLGQLFLILGFASYLYSAIRFTPGVDPTPVYYSSFARLYQFLIPAAVVFLFAKKPPRNIQLGLRYLLQMLLLVALIVPFFTVHFDSLLLYYLIFPLYTLGATAYLWLTRDDRTPFFLKGELWSALAKRSYSLYLWQYATMTFVAAYMARQKTSFVLQLVISIVLWLIMGEISYLLTEGGAIKLHQRKVSQMTQAIRAAGLSLGESEEDKETKAKKNISRMQAGTIVVGLVLVVVFLILPIPESEVDAVFDESVLRQAEERASQIAEARTKATTTSSILQTSSTTTAAFTTTEATTTTMPSTVPEDPLTGPFTDAQLEWLANLNVTIVGDSVIKMAAPDVTRYIPNVKIYAEVSRQMWDAPGILASLQQQGELGDMVVIALGTNGPYGTEYLEKIVSITGDRPLIFINSVMPNEWEWQVNETLDEFVEATPGTYLVDWYEHAKERTDLLYNDFTHPMEGTGTVAYANLLMWKLLEIGELVVV